ncbi:hypothetical protein J4E83_007229 [Alternaria metachromatica]|uniref:uncharacterized protein n=1 Tax=Alternaria metachromatica TaxID=283354 RepID=UPI0020C3DF9A|nr:uncharacterized protein J4E83_007229 [Alternaria metachromatica]KAI4614575.1 hypothetical protein J4E83_007229 [Alternaria metachromatica]
MHFVQRKVRVDLANFDRFVAGTWGANYIQRRDLYKGKLLAKIGYAAAAWFLHDPTKTELEGGIRWGLTKVATHMLEQLQREILKSLTRARAFTPSIAMENEFHVLPILLKLHQLAMNHRCRQYGSADYKLLDEALEIKDPYRGCTQDRKEMAMHPYAHLRALAGLHVRTIREEEQHSLSEPAFAESWADPKKRGEWIKKFNFRVVFHHANIAYKLYLNLRMLSRQPMHPTHKADFGDHILQYYVGLKPAQTTMGIGLRTGNLPLKSNWQWCQMNGITDNRCPLCEKAVHTAEHLLCHCTALETERGFLRSAVGRLDWHSLVTKDLEITTAWAIAFFGIDQFKWCLDDKDFQFPRGRRVHISFRN